MRTVWVVTGSFTAPGVSIALFHDYSNAVDFVCEFAHERWSEEEWYSDSAVRQAMIDGSPYGDEEGTISINEMEVQ